MLWRHMFGGLAVMIVAIIVPRVGHASGRCGQRQVTPAVVQQFLTEGSGTSLLLIDARSRDDFLAGTIPTAVNIMKLQDIIAGPHQDMQKAYVVVVTKDGTIDGPTRGWVQRLCGAGVDTRVLQGGISGWLAKGLGLERPEDRLTVPGKVPFVIPRGLCEMNDPVLEYN